MARLAGVDEQRRRAGGGQGGGNLARHMAALAHAGDDDAAFNLGQPGDRVGKAAVELAGEGGNRPRLDVKYPAADRSEEHTSELQSLMRISYAVFCLKKKKQ